MRKWLPGVAIAKLGRDGNVTTTVLVRICEALNCDIADICEVVPNEQENAQRERRARRVEG
ncbi:helix-turn-helix domain-containing protein [Trueperella abortisuis]|uniref:helix-turn-helix domain-containing protein n=1 Tax=Trueperella abortisuis TaxID=445930 RepID=UPI0027D90A3A|nr:helix-turn-helix transcriptional regulator [Trueperella abortisuis]